MRQEEQAGHPRSRPGPRRAQAAPLRRDAQPHRQPGTEPERAELVQQRQPEQRAPEEPPPPRLAARVAIGRQQPREDEDRGRPQQRLQRVHRVEVVERPEDGIGEEGEGSQQDAPARGAEFACERHRQQQRGGSPERREHPHGDEPVPEERGPEAEQRDGERRVIDVPPRQMARAGEVVELVDEPAVPARDRELDQQLEAEQ